MVLESARTKSMAQSYVHGCVTFHLLNNEQTHVITSKDNLITGKAVKKSEMKWTNLVQMCG